MTKLQQEILRCCSVAYGAVQWPLNALKQDKKIAAEITSLGDLYAALEDLKARGYVNLQGKNASVLPPALDVEFVRLTVKGYEAATAIQP
jgi:sulfur transfer complex TusBCD TusB component (DsrH family)